MKLENLEKAIELGRMISEIDRKIEELNQFNFAKDDMFFVGNENFRIKLSPSEIGPEKASEIQNELWDALLKTKADLTAELEKL